MIKEKEINSKQIYINGIINIIRSPYFNFLRVNEVPEELWNEIFCKLFKQKVIYSYSDRNIYDENNNVIYSEFSNGGRAYYHYNKNQELILIEEYNPNID